MAMPLVANASYVTYTTTRTIESVPYTDSGFYYSDGRGNSISYTKTRSVPVVVTRYPTGVWAYYGHEYLPPNAVIQQYVNGRAVYVCRVLQGNRTMYGSLVPNEGCYIHGRHSQPYISFQILLR